MGRTGRTGGRALMTRLGGRADERTSGRGGKAADGRADGGGKGADSGANGRTSGRADGWTGPSGQTGRGRRVRRMGGRGGGESAGWADGRTGAYGRTGSPPVGRTGGRADERVGLNLKGHIPRGPLHSWAPSPLASSKRERAGCLGV